MDLLGFGVFFFISQSISSKYLKVSSELLQDVSNETFSVVQLWQAHLLPQKFTV